MKRAATSGLLGLTAIAATLLAPVAGAQTVEDHYPETPKLNPALPIINTTHGSDGIKANILNPHPVCNSAEDYRTVVYKISDDFTPVGTVSTRNDTSHPIPLTQKTSREQTISLTVNGSQTEKLDVNAGGTASGKNGSGQAGIAYSLARQIGAEASYSLTWSVGQDIGPYDIEPGHTGEATYGFRSVAMTGTQQFCRADGTWSNPLPWRANVPLKNEVVVKQYDNLADSFGGAKPTSKAPASTNAPATSKTPAPTTSGAEYADVADTTPAPSAPAESNVPTTAPATSGPGLDLEPHVTVSPMKAPGFAGTVAIRVHNVGEKRYFSPDRATTFRIDVHTADGPQGVDRLITPRWMNGAYVRDLGFDESTSTRSFEVTLSNPVGVDEDQLIAALDFGDGATKEGRLVNYITVTQTGRLADDTSTGNDQDVDSRHATTDDFGRSNDGLF